MNINNEFLRREDELNSVLKDCESKLKWAPKGWLKIKTRNGKVYYYHRKDSKDKCGKYIKKNDFEKAKRLVQRDYELKVKEAVNKEIDAIESYKRKMPKVTYEQAYDNFSCARKVLITPHFVPDEEYVKNWLEEPYEPSDVDKGNREHYTDRGELVRSKSEVMIANALNRAGIPYKYECPLFVGDKKIHPDFTILKMPSRKVIYWEHLGKMDDPGYVAWNSERLDDYESNGIFIGDQLIISRETMDRPLNLKLVLKMIDHYLM